MQSYHEKRKKGSKNKGGVRYFLEIFGGFLLINIIIKDKIYIVVGRILRFWKPSDG